MVDIYVPEFVEEELQILMSRKDWFHNDILGMPNDKLYVQYDDYLRDLEAAEEELQMLEEEVWHIRGELEDLREEADQLRGRIDEMVGEKEELFNRIDEMVEEKEELFNRIDEMVEEKEELFNRIDEMEKQ